MKTWYKFWKKSGSMQSLDEDYILLDDEIYSTEKHIKQRCEEWAEIIGGRFNTHYSYGFESIDKPPKEWLNKQIKRLKAHIQYTQKEITELKTYL